MCVLTKLTSLLIPIESFRFDIVSEVNERIEWVCEMNMLEKRGEVEYGMRLM